MSPEEKFKEVHERYLRAVGVLLDVRAEPPFKQYEPHLQKRIRVALLEANIMRDMMKGVTDG